MSEENCESCQGTAEPLAQLLLKELRSESDKNKEDFVVFECSDGKRYVHSAVVRARLPHYESDVGKMPVTVDSFDRVIDFMYLGTTGSFKYHQIMELFSAADRLDYTELKKLIQINFETKLQSYMTESRFREACAKSPEVTKIFDGVRLESKIKIDLLRKFGTENSSLCLKLLTCSEPPSMSYLIDRGDKFKVFDVVTQDEIPCRVDFSKIDKSQMLILKGKLFARASFKNGIVIYDFSTGECIQEISVPHLVGITAFNEEIFLWTSDEIFVLKFRAASYTWSLKSVTKTRALTKLFILRRTKFETIYAAENIDEISLIRVKPTEDADEVIHSTSGYKLLGTYAENVYIMSQHMLYYMNLNSSNILPLIGESCLRLSMCDGSIYVINEERQSYGEDNFEVNFTRINLETQDRSHSGKIFHKHKYGAIWFVPTM